MARPERFELPTTRFEAEYSIQLSYGRVLCCLLPQWLQPSLERRSGPVIRDRALGGANVHRAFAGLRLAQLSYGRAVSTYA